MKRSVHSKFTVIVFVIGFMLAVQYNTIQKPEVRDTRDIWTIRQELAEEKKLHSELLSEIRGLDRTLRKYESLTAGNAGKVLMDTVDELYSQAGLTEKSGPGLTIKVTPSPESVAFGHTVDGISPDLLMRFVNEVNRYKGLSMEIDGKRYTSLSAIRDINGITTVNGLNVSTPPFTIKILTKSFEDAKKMYNYLLASPIHDEFYLDNLVLDINEPVTELTVLGSDQHFENQYLQELPKGE